MNLMQSTDPAIHRGSEGCSEVRETLLELVKLLLVLSLLPANRTEQEAVR